MTPTLQTSTPRADALDGVRGLAAIAGAPGTERPRGLGGSTPIDPLDRDGKLLPVSIGHLIQGPKAG
jgi:hypothetical protein